MSQLYGKSTKPPNVFIATPESIQSWLEGLARTENLYAPRTTAHGDYRYENVVPGSLVSLREYRPSLSPPGKKFSPSRDVLFKYKKGEDGEVWLSARMDDTKRIIAGVRPCDLKAIFLMDQVNRDGFPDDHYLSRRHNTLIVGVDCLQPCDELCFCAAAGSLEWRDGADLFLTFLDDQVFVEVLSEQGENLISNAHFSPCADVAGFKAAREKKRADPFGRQLATTLNNLPALLASQWNSPLWKRHVERCFSCGTCNLVCPTCYCFDVRDDFDLTGPDSGQRLRSWDSCMLPNFSEVAGGHNFRPQPAARQRHRVKRKFLYLVDRFGEGSFCVGCGRCRRQCTSGIDIFQIVNDLVNNAEVAS